MNNILRNLSLACFHCGADVLEIILVWDGETVDSDSQVESNFSTIVAIHIR